MMDKNAEQDKKKTIIGKVVEIIELIVAFVKLIVRQLRKNIGGEKS